MNQALIEILKNTKKDLSNKKTNPGSFLKSISGKKRDVSIIAEIKLASPTEKNLGLDTEIIKIAKEYESAKVDAISIITEKSIFKGDISFIIKVKSSVDLPILQKDFVIDPLQIYEAKFIGSDALLLIAKILEKETLSKFVDLCLEIGIEPVIEINNEKELEKAIKTKTRIIAVNARDLDTLKVDVDRACNLMQKIPDKFIKLGFSGIRSSAEVKKYKDAGAKGVLVGTELMKAKNVKEFLKGLRI